MDSGRGTWSPSSCSNPFACRNNPKYPDCLWSCSKGQQLFSISLPVSVASLWKQEVIQASVMWMLSMPFMAMRRKPVHVAQAYGSSSSLQLQPKHYQGERTPQSHLPWFYTGVSGSHCYQGQICTKFFNPPLPPWLSYGSSPLRKAILGSNVEGGNGQWHCACWSAVCIWVASLGWGGQEGSSLEQDSAPLTPAATAACARLLPSCLVSSLLGMSCERVNFTWFQPKWLWSASRGVLQGGEEGCMRSELHSFGLNSASVLCRESSCEQ